MKKLFIGLSLFFALIIVLIIVWIAHSFNAEAYRKQIIDSLSDMTGRAVEIKGPVDLSWTPFPVFVISDLTVANQEESSNPTMLSVEQVRAEIEWGSLFKRPLRIKKVELKNPTLLLERIKGNQTNFNFSKLFKPGIPQEDGSFIEGKNDLSLIIDDVQVSDGTFLYENKLTNQKFKIPNINGVGKIGSLDGPFNISGEMQFLGKKHDFQLEVKKVEVAQPVLFSLYLSEPESDTIINFSDCYIVYSTKNPEEWLSVSGVFRSNNPNLFLKEVLPDWPQKPIKANFSLDITARKLVLKELTVHQSQNESDIEKSKEETNTSLYLGKEQTEEETKRIIDIKNADFSELYPLLKIALKNKLFSGVKDVFHLQFENIRFKSAVLQKGEGNVSFDEDVLTLSDFSSKLPYDSSVEFNGKMVLSDEDFKGDFNLQTQDFRSLFNWMTSKELKGASEQLLKNAQLIGALNWKPNNWNVQLKTGVLDKVQFNGSIEIQEIPDHLVKIKGKIDNLDLNEYFPNLNLVEELKTASWKENSISFDLNGLNLGYSDKKIANYAISGQVKGNNLNLQNVLLEQEDKTLLKVSGDIENIGTDSLSAKQLMVDFTAPEKTPLYSKLQSELSLLKGSKELQGSLLYTGTQKQGKFQLDVQADKLHMVTDGQVGNLSVNPEFEELNFSFTYPEIQDFLSSFPDVRMFFPMVQGNLTVSLQGSGTKRKIKMDNLSLSVGKQTFVGNGILDIQEKNLNLSMNTPELYMDLFFPKIKQIFSNDKRPFKIEKVSDWNGQIKLQSDQTNYNGQKMGPFKGHLLLGKQNLKINNFDIAFPDNKGHLQMAGNIILTPSVEFSGTTNISEMPVGKDGLDFGALSLNEGKLILKSTLSMKGNSWGDLASSLQGNGHYTWNNGDIIGIDLSELVTSAQKALKQKTSSENISKQVKHALSNGKTPFSTFDSDFKLEKGRLIIPEVSLKTKQGDVLVNKVNWFIPKNDLDAKISFVLNELKDFPSLGLQLYQNKVSLQTETFEKALQQEIKTLTKEEELKQQEKNRQREEKEQEQIQLSAQEILIKSEKQIQEIKNKVALNSSESTNALLKQSDEYANEIRQLAVQTVLSSEQYQTLKEKSKLLDMQVQELDQLLIRQDVVGQKNNVQELLSIVEDRLSDMTRIYKRNSTSAILAGLLQGSQVEAKKMREKWGTLQKSRDIDEAANLVKEIKTSYQKIEKAWNYANQLENGIVPSSTVTGTISVVEG